MLRYRRAEPKLGGGIGLALALAGLTVGPVLGQEVAITETMPSVEVVINGQTLRIARQGTQACPPDCIQPIAPVRGIKAAGALEVLAFLQAEVAPGTGVLIDARMPNGFATGSVPGAVNVPSLTLDPANAYRNDILAALGAVPTGGDSFDFANAVKIVLFSDGPTSGSAVEAIRHLRTAGYPVEKLLYFRGGMQEWQAMGLTSTLKLDDTVLTVGGTP